jgi:hypothetical protein
LREWSVSPSTWDSLKIKINKMKIKLYELESKVTLKSAQELFDLLTDVKNFERLMPKA